MAQKRSKTVDRLVADTERMIHYPVRNSDPQTSRDAAASLTPMTLSVIRRQVYDAVRALGTATTDEVCEHMYGDRFRYRSTISRRLTDLLDMGLTELAGTRTAESGRKQQAFRVTEGEGRLF